MRKVDNKENSVFKYDRFLMSFQMCKSQTVAIIFYIFDAGIFKHLNKIEKDIFSLIPRREKDYYLTEDE